jgi:hypothetical protein
LARVKTRLSFFFFECQRERGTKRSIATEMRQLTRIAQPDLMRLRGRPALANMLTGTLLGLK